MWLFMSFAASAVHPGPQAISSVTQADRSPQWSEAVNGARRIIRAALVEQNLPGVSVAVGADGRIGTASTVLTSAAVGLLLERHRLKLDDDIQAYVLQFPQKQWPVTRRQLMAHVGGVGTDSGDDGPLLRQRCERPVEALQHFAQGELLFEPGTQYRHSKYGWILVSAATEAAAAQPFLTFIGEQIFRPLGMDHTGAESATQENPERVGEPAEDAPFLTFIRQVVVEPLGIGGPQARSATAPATFYLPGFGNDPIVRYGLHVMPARNLSCYAGSTAFLSTPSDLVRFGLTLNGGTLLQPATVRLLQTPQQLTSGQETNHGLEWDLRTVTLAGEPAQAVGQEGDLQGKRVGR